MYEKFHELPHEKQMKIINAAMEVFSQNEYKHAVTDDIAAKAGISKGSLFYYFHNKKDLYLYLYHYVIRVTSEQAVNEKFWEITGFFEALEHVADIKMKMLRKNPYMLDFSMRCFYSSGEQVSGELSELNTKFQDNVFKDYLPNVDFSKFKDKVDPEKVFRMIGWMSDGYLHDRQMRGTGISIEKLMEEFRSWVDMFRNILYKEEYLHECD